MYRKTKIMTKHTYSLLLGLSILLILGCWTVNADPPTPKNSDVEYKGYDLPTDPEGRKYHRFLYFPAPKELYYFTQTKAIGNIDDTPEKETIVLIVAETGVDGPGGEWCQAFLLIAEAETEGVGVPKKKELFKLFDAGVYDFDVPGKTIKLQGAPFAIKEVTSSRPWSSHIFFKLIDLTGDGTLDIWVQSYDGVAVISFQNGEFKEVCSAHSSFKSEDPIEYIDLDNDGIYEIKIPTRISIDGVPGAARPQWMSLYEWDGTTYILNNERFYAENDKFLIDLLNTYNHVLIRHGRYEEYSFYIGLVFYYRGDAATAGKYLQWVVKHAENDDFIQAAESLLKKLQPH